MPFTGSLPTYVPEQIAHYQGDHLLTHPVCRFDPAQTVDRLGGTHEVIAIDLGGDKVRRATCRLANGTLTRRDERVFQSIGGAGYLQCLEDVARDAAARDLPVGISSATRLEGSVITRTVNLPVFFEEFSAAYGADYERLFPARSIVFNDTISGIIGASTLLALGGMAESDVGFVICGSGLGASVLHDGMAIHVEAAHVPLAAQLNPLGQKTRCNVPGKDYVCLERVTAARAGIEDLYRQQTGKAVDGITIGRMYEDEDDLATLLYETSALALAHATRGVTTRYGFAEAEHSVVIYHGGIFELPKYRKALARNLAAMPGTPPRIVFSRDLSPNACLNGAAFAALSYRH